MKLKILTVIGIIIVIGVCATTFLNISNIEQKDRNIISYHEIVPYIYTIMGFLLLATAWITYHLHVLAGVIQYGLGALMTTYGIYLLSIKFGLL